MEEVTNISSITILGCMTLLEYIIVGFIHGVLAFAFVIGSTIKERKKDRERRYPKYISIEEGVWSAFGLMFLMLIFWPFAWVIGCTMLLVHFITKIIEEYEGG